VEVTIAAASQDYLRRRNVRSSDGRISLEDVDGVPFLWIPAPEHDGSFSRVANMLLFGWRVSRLSKHHAGDLQAVIGSTPQPFAAFAALRLARRLNVPFILEVRDIWPKTLMDLGNYSRWHPLIALFAWIERRLLASARGVITLLPGSESYFEGRGVAASDVVAIPNGVDLSLVAPPTCASSDGRFTVTYAGAHGMANALHTIIHAAKLLQDAGKSDVRVRLIGDGPEKPRLVREANEFGLNNLEFVDPVAKALIYEELAASDAFAICLKRAEVFDHGVSPNKLFDYFSVGRPVIFAVNASNNPVAEAHAGITVPAEDPKALADAMLRLRDMSASERFQLGLNGRAYVQAHHDFARLAERLGEQLRTWLT
jgi:glycosyltransferase involved in cell wall biosynthesis